MARRASRDRAVLVRHRSRRRAAVRERGRVVQCGRIELKCTGAFLQLRLPSGRKISYPHPRIIVDERGKLRVVFTDNAAGQFKDCRNGHGAYGGTWTENIVAGIARDLLAEAMLRIEAAGYPIVLHVHDEIVCRGADRLRQHGRIHRTDDRASRPGRRGCRSQPTPGRDRATANEEEERYRSVPADTRAPSQPQPKEVPWCC